MRLKIIIARKKFVKFLYLIIGLLVTCVGLYGIIFGSIGFFEIVNVLGGLASIFYFFTLLKKTDKVDSYELECLNFEVIEA